MFRPAIAVIFREVFPEGYITCNVKTMYVYKMLIILQVSTNNFICNFYFNMNFKPFI
jgi:hypothetical protein